jgi:hypothetical protein
VKTARTFKCPSDQSLTKLAYGNLYARVRSYSMNAFMGTRAADNGGNQPAATFLRRTEFVKVRRAELLVFIDVHEDSLTSSIFNIDGLGDIQRWSHLPGSRHAKSGVISYIDGHAEIHRWRDERTLVPVKGILQGGIDVTGSPDWRYVWERSTKTSMISGGQ